MREYKFRGKRKDNGEWVKGDLIRVPKDCGSYNEPPSLELVTYIADNSVLTHEFIEVLPKTVSQSTGLHDKDGKEIWEGDIVRIFEHRFSPCDFEVMFCDINYCWWLSGVEKREEGGSYQSYSFSNLNGFGSDSKVIGNIWDNPEMKEGR